MNIKKRNRIKIILVLLCVLLLLVWRSKTKEIVKLVVTGETQFYEKPNWEPGKSVPILVAKKNDKFPVVECLDIKSDILIKVDLDGKSGFVAGEAYFLQRRNATFWESWSSQYAISSCKGMFKNISKYN